MNDFLAEIRKIPPVTRLLCISSLSVTGSSMLKIVNAYKIIYAYPLVFEQLQIWRLYTSFFLGSGGINYVFELVMLYRSMDQLESGPYANRSADLAWQLFAAGVGILVASIPVKSFVFFRPLLLCIAYVDSALAPPGAQTSLLGLVRLPIRFLPYVMLGMDLLMGGPGAVAHSLPGAVVGHLWWWGVWGPEIGGAGGILHNWGAAPRWLAEWMGQTPPPGPARANSGGGVQVIPPRRPAAAAPAGSRTTGYNWGSGQRLGEE
ncbi:Der1-like family-domain-containing protein [Mycena pura]|uniref:Derlin n=1 Tax=Mycena pura TaxID=153505 RepID=A0AAD6V411_9AGAR|nr:Der1-like family-domain-containing protein [Mycena pura]